MRRTLTRSQQDFLLCIFSVFEGFSHKSKHYLAYLQAREKHDEFLMRDSLVKPLFQALGYDQQKDFSPEETSATGRADLVIRNSQNRPIIVIETQSSLPKKLDYEHRKRLFDYAKERGARLAVLTDGVFLEVWKGGDQLVALNCQELYSCFVKDELESLSESDLERLLKLRFLHKEIQAINPEDLLPEPELDISQATVFDRLLEDLQGAMELVKDDILSKFDALTARAQEYQKLIAERRKLHPGQARKYEPALKFQKSYEEWRQVSNSNGREAFCTETMYIFFNRILLMRLCEDKGIVKRQISNGGIKDWMTWKGFTKFAGVNYSRLLDDAYELMDDVYPHLFHRDVFDWYVPDSEITLRVLFVFNQYNFACVDRDVLGKLYEKYLDREERKRLGQFYTPEEVVDYILEAVGYTAENEIEGKRLLDPACGSGGFLVRATKTLVERLKKRGLPASVILEKVKESIYGFDVNPFACHIAEMNLLFQVIDLIKDAQRERSDFQVGKFHIFKTDSLKRPEEDKPPESSLFETVVSEYVEDAQLVQEIKLRQSEFTDGFDFVVGNPPYVRQEKLKALKDHFKKHYECYHGVADLYVYFYELGLRLLCEGGKLGFISSNKFFRAGYGKKLREFLGQQYTLETVIDFGDLPVFEATTYPCILIVRKEPPAPDHQVRTLRATTLDVLEQLSKHVDAHGSLLPQAHFAPEGWRLESPTIQRILEKIKAVGVPLGEYVQGKFYRGIVTGLNEAFVIDEATRARLIAEDSKSAEIIKPFLRGQDIKRWRIDYQNLYLIFARRGTDIEDYPAIKKHLEQYKERLMPGSGRKSGNYQWHEIQDTIDYYAEFEKPKLVYPDIAESCQFALDENSSYMGNTAYFIPANDKYLLALLNSKLMNFYYHRLSPEIRGGFMRFFSEYMEQVPIAPAPPEVQQEIEKLVAEMLDTHRELPQLDALMRDFPRFVREQNIQTQDLADTPGIKLQMEKPLGRPKIRREGRRVYLTRNAYLDCNTDELAEYLELYLTALGSELRSKDTAELVKLVSVPKGMAQIRSLLRKREELQSKMAGLARRSDELDGKLNERVYKLYDLTADEVKWIEGGR